MLKWMLSHLPLLMGFLGFFVIRLVLLMGTLWGMLRAQDLNYEFPALLGSAAAASACDMIPFVGHPLAVVVLTLCVLKMTQAHFIDVRFTVAISYAVMFLIQMLVLSALPTPVNAKTRDAKAIQEMLHPTDNEEADVQAFADGTPSPKTAPKVPIAPTNATIATNPVSTALSTPTNKPITPETVAVKGTVPKPAVPLEKSPQALAKIFSLKGMVSNGQYPMAIIKAGAKTFTLQVGETASLTTADEVLDFSLAEVTQDGAVLKVGDTRVSLHLR